MFLDILILKILTIFCLQEQENSAKTRKRQKADNFNWYSSWRDDDDHGSPGGSCGGGGGSGGLGDLDTSGARFVF